MQSAASLPVFHVPLTKDRGVLKACMWCGHGYGRVEEAPIIEPARHAGRMKCESCGRQTGWVSARTLRRIERAISSMTSFTWICTQDGTVIARDPESGLTASGRSVEEALAELRRLLSRKVAA